MGTGVIYGLTDSNGRVFYVGQSKNLKKRLRSYKCGCFHGNKRLEKSVKKHGLNHVVLRSVNLEYLDQAEYEEISKRSRLTNVIMDPRKPFCSFKEKKPWVVPGVKAPSSMYLHNMRIRFGKKCEQFKDALSKKTDEERMVVEMKLAERLLGVGLDDQIEKWSFSISKRLGFAS